MNSIRKETGLTALSIIIPCYNEQHRIIPTLKEIFAFFDSKGISGEVIVLDDASTDDCVQLMKDNFNRPDFFVHELPRNRGKGFTIKLGFEMARGRHIIYMDADLAVPLAEVINVMDALEKGYEIVIGIRIFEAYNASRFRRIIGFGLLLYANVILSLPQVSDTQCGFKGFTREIAKKMAARMRISGGMFDLELLHMARLWGVRIKSLPVTWYDRPGSTIRLFRCLIKDPFDVVRIRLNSFLGRYH